MVLYQLSVNVAEKEQSYTKTTQQKASVLTLARTCYFPILERTWGGATPHAISPLFEIELWELISLGHILTPPGRVKEKKIAH